MDSEKQKVEIEKVADQAAEVPAGLRVVPKGVLFSEASVLDGLQRALF